MPTSLRELQNLLEFEDSDLAANRKGKLSKGQIEWLHGKARQDLKMLLAIPVLVVAWLMLTLPFELAFPTVFLIGAMMAGFISLHKLHLQSINEHPVRKISGHLQKHLDDPRLGITSFVITINGHRFPVDRYFFEQISEGKFTIYLYDKHILCMEPLRTTSKTAAARSKPKPSAKGVARKPAPKSSKSSAQSKSATSKPKSTKSKAASMKNPAIPKAEKPAKATGKAPERSLQRTRRAS